MSSTRVKPSIVNRQSLIANRQTAAVLLFAPCLLAAALGLFHLGHNSYWLDEAVSVRLAEDPWRSFVRTIRTTEANMALYYLLLRAWVQLGDGEASVRLLSCLLGTLTVPALYAVGARLFDRATGLAAALLLAVDTGHLWASQEARSYALVMCLTTVSWWLLLRAADAHPGRASWIAWATYVVAAALAVYAHFYAALVLLAQAPVALWLPLRTAMPVANVTGRAEPPVRSEFEARPSAHVHDRDTGAGAPAMSDSSGARGAAAPGRISRGIVLACTVALVALLWPLLRFLLAQPHHNIDWIGTAHQNPLLGIVSPVVHPTSVWGLAAVAALVVVGPVAMAVAWRRVATPTRWRCAVVLLWLGVPVVVAVATTLALAPVIDQRYLTICLPPLALAAAAALTHLWPPRWSLAALLVVLALDAVSLSWYYTHLGKENWRAATAYVADRAAPGDRILFYAPYVHIPFDLYRARSGAMRDASPLGPARGQSLATAVAEFRTRAPRVWLVLSHADSPACGQAIAEAFHSRFATLERHDFAHIEVHLFSGLRPPLPVQSPRPDSIATACPQQ